MKALALGIICWAVAISTAFGQNNAATQQSGDGNQATISQEYQAGGSGDMNTALVTQNGGNNKVMDLNQLGAGNSFTIKQVGSGNRTSEFTDQGGSDGRTVPSFDGVIEISQIGNDNFVDDADQVGTGNELYINQGAEGSPGSNNYVTIDAQVSIGGTGNLIRISQSGDNNAVGNSNTQAGAFQQGSGNTMNITQSGGATAGANAELTPPAGDFDNRFFKSQFGGEGLIQLGSGNQLIINQDGASSVNLIYQNGIDNMADIMQIGADNAATVMQVGVGNTANITQNGLGNTATISQQ